MAKKGPMELALAQALRDIKAQPGDAAIVALAKQYARTLDAPSHLDRVPNLVADVVDRLRETEETAEILSALVDALAMSSTLSALGAGYRMTLVELGLTPKVRAVIMRGQPQQVPQASSLDELRARRARRAQ